MIDPIDVLRLPALRPWNLCPEKHSPYGNSFCWKRAGHHGECQCRLLKWEPKK